jgi:UDP-4-amino-4,6-dideoxy-N-acetyl-beta-L-altrosamine N-acetyltransferase
MMMIRAALRPVDETDRDRLLAWRNDSAVAAFMYSDHPIGRAEHDRWFDALPANSRRRDWIVEVDGRPAGLNSLVDIDRDQGRATVARYLAPDAPRGVGLGGFAEFKMIDHAFGPMGLRKLWSEVLASNEVAWTLHMTHGFQREALFRAHVVKGGAPRDVIGLGLLAEDWVERRPAARTRLLDKGFSVEALDAPLV